MTLNVEFIDGGAREVRCDECEYDFHKGKWKFLSYPDLHTKLTLDGRVVRKVETVQQ